jgi:hypothetical protein
MTATTEIAADAGVIPAVWAAAGRNNMRSAPATAWPNARRREGAHSRRVWHDLGRARR